MRQIKGFTLIELLIVVAIIAILAAIAVPNFLEAQTRSKVSRCKADMRAIATAIEIYRVDNNNYFPPDQTRRPNLVDYGTWGNLASLWWLQVKWSAARGTPHQEEQMLGAFLTTPVTYITSIPGDPFNSNMDANRAVRNWGAVPLEGAAFYSTCMNNCIFNVKTDNTTIDDVEYLLFNVGPDAVLGFGGWSGSGRSPRIWNITFLNLYDPTNGTVSTGDIAYAGKGGGFQN